jgi:hypothetical protein
MGSDIHEQNGKHRRRPRTGAADTKISPYSARSSGAAASEIVKSGSGRGLSWTENKNMKPSRGRSRTSWRSGSRRRRILPASAPAGRHNTLKT